MNKYTPWALLGLAALPTNAFFLMPCWPVSTQRLDPIVNPYDVSPHVHQIAGGNGFSPAMNYSDTQAATCTTCFVKGDKSNYWIPAMYMKHADGTFERVLQVGSASMYYFNEPSRLGPGEKFEPFPKGLRMLAGDPLKRSAGTDAASQAINYKCLDYSGTPSDSSGFPSKNCANGVRAEITFPSCWDGKNLDSSDHQSHMAYPTGNFENGACPSTHPHHLVTLKVEFIFDTNSFKDQWTGGQQPFVWSSGDPTGYGLHADYLMGWDYDLLSKAVSTCFDEYGVLANCAPFAGQIQSAYVNPGTCKVDSMVNEEIGGKIDAMPGCNSLQTGPGLAKKVPCNSGVKLMGKWANAQKDGGVPDVLVPASGSGSSTSAVIAVAPTTTSVAVAAAPTTTGKTTLTSPDPSTSTLAFYGQDGTAAGQSSTYSSMPAADSPNPNSSQVTGETSRGVKIVTITDIVTETVYTTMAGVTLTALTALNAPVPTPTVRWGGIHKREIGDDVHKHHLRHLKLRRRRQIQPQN